ncbi:MAG: 6-bladed beta-propeller [Thermoplasmata archaeon]
MRYLLVVLIGIFSTTCKVKESQNVTFYHVLAPIFARDFINDTTFLHDVNNIAGLGDNFLILDIKQNKIYVLNSKLELISGYGVEGEGPGEFILPERFYIDNKNIYILNAGKGTIEKVFVDQFKLSYLKTIPLVNELKGMVYDTRFFYHKGLFYLSAPVTGSPIILQAEDGVLIDSIGIQIKNENDPRDFLNNGRFLFLTDDDFILSICVSYPLIEFYKLNGERESVKSLNIKPIIDRKKYIEQQPMDDDAYYWYFRDCYLHKNFLLLLLISGKEEPVCNAIAVFEIQNKNDLNFKGLLKLPGVWYSTIGLTNDLLLAFETTRNTLELYHLNFLF